MLNIVYLVVKIYAENGKIRRPLNNQPQPHIRTGARALAHGDTQTPKKEPLTAQG